MRERIQVNNNHIFYDDGIGVYVELREGPLEKSLLKEEIEDIENELTHKNHGCTRRKYPSN